MTVSLPSKKIAVVDTPEVEEFSADFVYNFFVPDERVNETGTAPDRILKQPTESFDASFVSKINKTTPRFIRFNWKSTFKGDKQFLSQRVSIKDNFKKIHNEQNFTTDEYTNILFQDTGIDNKVSFYVEQAIEQIEKSRTQSELNSPLDIIKTLNTKTSEEITSNFLINSFNNLRRFGVRFIDQKLKKELINETLKDLKEVKTRTQLNNKLISYMLNSVEEDGVGLFSDEIKPLLSEAASIQEKAISSKSSTIINSLDYDFEILDYVGYRKIDTQGFDSIVQVIGYVIDKEEILEDGTVAQKEPIIIESPLVGTTIDLKVKYGATYVYRIRSISYVEVQAEEHDANSVIAISFLVSSKDSQQVVVNCHEEVPPPWPSDFNVSWDYRELAARLIWSFPPNSQRDIKKFQVFRRKSIYEPFQLIKMYDFDDSFVRSPYHEIPDAILLETLSSPKTYFLDKEFTKDSKFIYALCSVDAHGITSNFSSQFEVSFNRFTNKMVRKLISTGGAPKAYPNLYLLQDTFVDTIRDSGHTSLKIYFAPEYMKLLNDKGDDLELIKTDLMNSSYKLQLINLDLQSQKQITINILDKRTSADKNK